METFHDLPEALVRDLVEQALPVATTVGRALERVGALRAELRRRAAGLIGRKADLEIPREPSVAAIDGSYQVHRLTSVDLCAAAAVAVEGTSREGRRHWPEPHHRVWVGAVPHQDDTVRLLRARMTEMELDLAWEAPHDLVLLDGSFASLVIYLNQGFAGGVNAGNTHSGRVAPCGGVR